MADALPMVPDPRLPWVHVRDVADANIEAMTSETAGASRTIVATDPSSLIDAAVLRERLPEASGKIPTRAITTWLTWVASVFEPQLRDNRWLIGSARAVVSRASSTIRTVLDHGRGADARIPASNGVPVAA